MRILPLIAASAFVFVSAAAQAEPRSLSLSGVDQKLPGSLGKAAETPKVVEATKPPDPRKPPEPAKAVEAAPAPAPAAEPPKEAPAFVQRPSVVGTKPAQNREGQVTFDETKPAVPAATTTPENSKQTKTEQVRTEPVKTDKPRRKRQHWDEARIMREISRYSGYAGMIGGW
jgi:hypothetical protein